MKQCEATYKATWCEEWPALRCSLASNHLGPCQFAITLAELQAISNEIEEADAEAWAIKLHLAEINKLTEKYR